MSLCRWSEKSDLYIYQFGWWKYHCCLCPLSKKDVILFSPIGVVIHVLRHKQKGDVVPVKKILRSLWYETSLGHWIYTHTR